MSEMIIRDPETMEIFVHQIGEYIQNMEGVCTALNNHIRESEDVMKDKTSHDAFDRIIEFGNNLKASLPYVEVAREKLKKAAEILREAQEIHI